MSECLAQTFLREGGSLAALEEVWGIKSRPGTGIHSSLVSLKYNQITSPFSDPLVRQCRGLILDSANNWEIIARPWDKFFNYGEGHAPKIDWDTAKVQEKLDGSLMILYWYKGDWRVATSGTPDGTGEVGPSLPGYLFRGLFWQTWNSLNMKTPHERWKDWTFMFELLTPYNRIVVQQEKSRIVFLSCRHVNGDEEMVGSDEFPCMTYNWPVVSEFDLGSLDKILSTFSKMDPLKQEGYVVIDSNMNRIKVKHPGYVALHHLKGDGFSPKRILDCVRSGEVSEIIASFPEWKTDFVTMQHRYMDLVGHLEHEYERLKDIPLQKAFALEAVKSRCPASLFALRSGKVQTIRGFLQNINIESLLVTLEAP